MSFAIANVLNSNSVNTTVKRVKEDVSIVLKEPNFQSHSEIEMQGEKTVEEELEEFLDEIKKSKNFLVLSEEQKEFILKILTEIYKTKWRNPWFKIPNSLILAQSILESWWGKSEYIMERNNPFWIYSKKNKKLVLKRFNSLGEAIKYYLTNLENHNAYKSLQTLIFNDEEPSSDELIEHLDSYSEDPKYKDKLRGILNSYGLKEYDAL